MTSIPTEQTDASQELDPVQREALLSPEAYADRVRSDVADFSSDVATRLSTARLIESRMNPEDVARARASAGVGELPALTDRVRTLGTETLRAIEHTAVPQGRVTSDRFRRALSGDVGSIETVEIGHTKPREVSEPVIRTESESNFSEREFEVEEPQDALVSPELKRLDRDLELAESVDRLALNQSLNQLDVERIAGVAGGRGWHKLFSEVKSGDALVAFLVPGDEYASIKRLNDVLFGPQKTDDLIKKRRDILLSALSETGCERVATSYKDEYFRISQDQLNQEGSNRIMQTLSEVAEWVRVSMTTALTEASASEWQDADEKRRIELDAFVRSLLGDEGFERFEQYRGTYLASQKAWKHAVSEEAFTLRGSFESSEERSDEVIAHAKELVSASYRLMEQSRRKLDREIVQPALADHPERGYRMTFGMGEVGESSNGSVEHIDRAVSDSLKGAMLARKTVEIGSGFSETLAKEAVEEVMKIRDSIGLQDLTDAEGNVYPVFDFRPDGKGNTVSVINIDLIREIRKGAFKPISDSRQAVLYRSVKRYLEAINILDMTKPYTNDEMTGGTIYGTDQTIEASVQDVDRLIHSLKDGSISPEDRKRLASLLRKEGKDRTCTSAMEFHRKALEISDCSYISLDVLDVGPELLQEYEQLIQGVANGTMSFDRARAIAGDETTRKMREFRHQVSEICREYCTDCDPIMSVGGDEIVLAMDTARVTDEFILKLRHIRLGDQREGSVRVVQTAVGGGRRTSESEGESRKREHLEAMKRAEQGTSIAKEIEKTIRRIRVAINDLPRAERSAHLETLQRLNLSDFAVFEREQGGFDLIIRDPNDPSKTTRGDSEEFRRRIGAILSDLRALVDDRRRLFYDASIESYPKLTKELVPIALRRKDQDERGFERFMSVFSE